MADSQTQGSAAEVGPEISRLREAVGMTVNQLATKTGLFTDYLLRIEQGREPVSAYALRKIADELRQAGADPHSFSAFFTSDPKADEEDFLAYSKQVLERERSHTRQEMLRHGLGLTWLGLLHFAADWLEHDWGYVLVAVGVATILIRRHFMLVFLALVLIVAGFSNLFFVAPPWGPVLAVLQFFWFARVRSKWLHEE